MKRPAALVILDGLGYRADKTNNAVAHAHKPTLDYIKEHYPHTQLQASGASVGLLDGMAGNSEVGHITIGAGRVIRQPIAIMHELVCSQGLLNMPIIREKFTNLAQSKKTLHVLGLLSDAGVHSHLEHAIELIRIAHHYGIHKVALHCFLDGRDTPPQSAEKYLALLERHIALLPPAFIASVSGRFFAMDRNKEWNRTEQVYRMLTNFEPTLQFDNWRQVLEHYYHNNITDEFIPPHLLARDGIVCNGDGIVFFNTRADRARQLTQAFVDPSFAAFKTENIKLLFFITPTRYGSRIKTDFFIHHGDINNTLMQVLSEHGLNTFAIAETEKYAHVTYFFNGGREESAKNETRILVPSITAVSYKDIPEMSAAAITERVLQTLASDQYDFYLINYANPDMVGHSGDFEATKKAVECVDRQVAQLYKKIVEELNGTLYVTADHGNAELNYNNLVNQVHTEHTANPVEFIFANQQVKDTALRLPLKELKDIAPFILKNLAITVPPEMQ